MVFDIAMIVSFYSLKCRYPLSCFPINLSSVTVTVTVIQLAQNAVIFCRLIPLHLSVPLVPQTNHSLIQIEEELKS